MGITLRDPRLASTYKHIRVIPADDFDRLLGVRADISFEDRKVMATDFYHAYEEIRKSLFGLFVLLDEKSAEIVTETAHVAYQHVQITAAMLESSDDPDGNPVERSVLTTASESVYEFNWKQSGIRMTKICLSTGDGVPDYPIIIDADDANILMAKLTALGDSVVMEAGPGCRPYGMSGVKLGFGQWRPRAGKMEFWPTSVSVGTQFDGWQILPMVHIP